MPGSDLNVHLFLPFIERATATLPNDDPNGTGKYAQPGSAIMNA